MYGLPETTDLDFLRGLQLTELSIRPFSTVLSFGEATRIVAEVDIVAHVERRRISERALVVAELVRCLGNPVEDVSWNREGTLRVSFAGKGVSLEIADESTSYESYAIHSGDQIIVV